MPVLDEAAEGAEPVDVRLELPGERFGGGRLAQTLSRVFRLDR